MEGGQLGIDRLTVDSLAETGETLVAGELKGTLGLLKQWFVFGKLIVLFRVLDL